jgi:hypothetical protein
MCALEVWIRYILILLLGVMSYVLRRLSEMPGGLG